MNIFYNIYFPLGPGLENSTFADLRTSSFTDSLDDFLFSSFSSFFLLLSLIFLFSANPGKRHHVLFGRH